MPNWKLIGEAPKDGSFIIGYDPQVGVCQIWWCSNFERWESLHNDYPMRACIDEMNFIFKADPSHWMPLPDPPNLAPPTTPC